MNMNKKGVYKIIVLILEKETWLGEPFGMFFTFFVVGMLALIPAPFVSQEVSKLLYCGAFATTFLMLLSIADWLIVSATLVISSPLLALVWAGGKICHFVMGKLRTAAKIIPEQISNG